MNDTMTPPRTQNELVRPHDGRVIAGVATAVARRLDVGVGWIRVAFVLASFFGGLGILLYIVGWLVIRDEREATPIAERWVGDLEGSSAWVGIGLIVVAGLVLLSATDLVRGELVLAAGLFLAGVLLYRGRLPGRLGGGPSSDFAPEAGSAAPAAATSGPATLTADDGGAAPPFSPARRRDSVPPPPPAPPRPPSYLGRIAVAVSLLVLGGIAVLDNLDVIDPGLRHYVAGVVLVLGLGLVVGSVYGRARGLIVLGLLAMPILFVSAAVRLPLTGEWGDRNFVPSTSVELQTEYALSGGQLVLDFRELAAVPDGASVTADVGVGQLTVIIPSDAGYDVIADASVGMGALNILGSEQGGVGVDQRVVVGPNDDRPDLLLQAEVGLGELVIMVSE